MNGKTAKLLNKVDRMCAGELPPEARAKWRKSLFSAWLSAPARERAVMRKQLKRTVEAYRRREA